MNIPFLDTLGLPSGVTRPTWVVLDLTGAYPERQPTQPLQAILSRTETVEALQARVEALAKSEWLHGVLVRVSEFGASPATAHAIRGILGRLAEKKRVVAYMPQVTMTALIAVSRCTELVAPESADVMVSGFAMEPTFMGAFLKKHGIEFENLRIKEYKSMLTRFSDEAMDDYNREQLTAYLEAAERAWVRDLAEGREVSEETARGWLEADFTSAQALHAAGVLTKVAYEDELIGPATRPLAAIVDLLGAQFERSNPKADRIAVVSVVGTIVPGKSRNNPLPLPLLGGPMVGSDTVVAALRRAKEDKPTKAIVVYVNSGGGSALASDLMWREIQTSEKPVVVVMGDTAASGGYYLAAGADRIIASPYTVTGSIGVVAGKPVLEQFNERQGLKPEPVGRQNALKYSASHPFTPEQREHMYQGMEEVYDRFVTRVAQGRDLSKERVNEIGRGRIWAGASALELGLVDELGDLHTGIVRAAELAGLDSDAPTWNVAPKKVGLLPELVEEAKDAAQVSVWPFGHERTLTWLETEVKLR